MPLQRIAVIGAGGSGKTTLGRWAESRLGLPFTHLDAHTLRNFASRRRAWPHDLAARPNLVVRRLRNDRQVSAWQCAVQAGNTPVDR
jgi:adenylate kinase family enzyme